MNPLIQEKRKPQEIRTAKFRPKDTAPLLLLDASLT